MQKKRETGALEICPKQGNVFTHVKILKMRDIGLCVETTFEFQRSCDHKREMLLLEKLRDCD